MMLWLKMGVNTMQILKLGTPPGEPRTATSTAVSFSSSPAHSCCFSPLPSLSLLGLFLPSIFTPCPPPRSVGSVRHLLLGFEWRDPSWGWYPNGARPAWNTAPANGHAQPCLPSVPSSRGVREMIIVILRNECLVFNNDIRYFSWHKSVSKNQNLYSLIQHRRSISAAQQTKNAAGAQKH